MQCLLLTVGDNKFQYLDTGEKEYLKRLKHYCPTHIESVKSVKMTSGRTSKTILKDEADFIRKRIKPNDYVVALDQSGHMMDSDDFARTICHWEFQGIQRMVFLIGGPLGLDDTLVKEANFVLSLSKMTFMHEMVRLIFLEQFYRAWTILRGEKYHR